MKEELEKLLEIGMQWIDYTEKDGDGHKYYSDGYIVCYHINGNQPHKSICFGNYYEDGIGIQFHNKPTFCATVNGFSNIDSIIDKGASFLEKEKKILASTIQEEKRHDRENRIKILRKELDALEGEVTSNENT